VQVIEECNNMAAKFSEKKNVEKLACGKWLD
jgi:hypothetical protein